MAIEHPPLRLSADPSTLPALRQLLDQARDALPAPTQLAEFTTRLNAAVEANVPAPNVSLPKSAISTGIASGKVAGLALGLLLGGTVAGGIWFGSRDNTAKAPAMELTSAHSVPTARAPAPALPLQPTLPAVASETRNSERTEPVAAGESRARKLQTQNREPANEAALLLAARAALSSAPERALRITKEHSRLFPNGALTQEREVIAIEALRRLGQTNAARQRGAAFEKKYPDSVHQSKVEQTLKGQ